MTRHLRPDVDANSGVLVFNLPQSNYQKVHESVARRQKNLTPITNLYLKLTLHGDVTELDIASSLLHCSIITANMTFLFLTEHYKLLTRLPVQQYIPTTQSVCIIALHLHKKTGVYLRNCSMILKYCSHNCRGRLCSHQVTLEWSNGITYDTLTYSVNLLTSSILKER